jgi:hypothetical protein
LGRRARPEDLRRPLAGTDEVLISVPVCFALGALIRKISYTDRAL